MNFGKLNNIDLVDFTLQSDPLQNTRVLGRIAPPAVPHIYIGPTGYNMKEWVGTWYPSGTKDKDFLKAFGKQFNTIEHNTTHYRIPDYATVMRWRDDTPADFRFCPKVPQLFSHARDLGLSHPELRTFWDRMVDFGEKMGCCFLQLPPYFEPKYLPVLERFIQKWPSGIPLAVEVRHASFFDGTPLGGFFFDMLENAGMCAVITDVSGRRDVCHMRLTNSIAMIRFVGNALDATDYSRVDAWTERMAAWFSLGLQEVYFFTHEPDNLLAPDLALYAHDAFKHPIPDAVLRGPTRITTPGAQGVLF
jgi:uncharacterized protein YecE (DUF72 family)